MTFLASTAPQIDEEEISTGGPIGALIIAIPISLALWAIVVFLLLNLVR